MISIGVHATSLLLWGIVVHLFCDWLLQNDWMARYKASLRHPAAYVHSGIHLIGLLLVFPPLAAVGIALSHLLIDTRLPLVAWRNVFRQTRTGPVALHVAMWGDQVAHITVLAVAAPRDNDTLVPGTGEIRPLQFLYLATVFVRMARTYLSKLPYLLVVRGTVTLCPQGFIALRNLAFRACWILGLSPVQIASQTQPAFHVMYFSPAIRRGAQNVNGLFSAFQCVVAAAKFFGCIRYRVLTTLNRTIFHESILKQKGVLC